jgi:integrase
MNTWHDLQVHDAAGRRKYLATDERARFLRAAESLTPRMRALCYVLAYAGCRVSEAPSLRSQHLDAEHFTLTLKTLKRCRPVWRASATGCCRHAKTSGRSNRPVLADAPRHILARR